MKKLISIILSVLMVVSIVPFSASAKDTSVNAVGETYTGTCGTNVKWSLNTETGELKISGTGKMYDYPGWYYDSSNYSRAGYMYYKSSIKSITIENGVTSIGNHAFSYHSSTSKYGTSDGIGETYYGLDNVTSISIPESVTSIGDYAFGTGSSLTSITIPSNVKTIGNHAFLYGTGLNEINVDNNNQNYMSFDGSLYTKDFETLIQYPRGKTDSYFDVPNGVTTIGSCAFGWSSLVNVSLPETVSSIGSYAFYYCTKLEHISIPEKVTSIPTDAFRYCSGLTSIMLTKNVTSIGNYAFYSCSKLTDVYYLGTKDEYSGMTIGSSENSYFTNATKHYLDADYSITRNGILKVSTAGEYKYIAFSPAKTGNYTIKSISGFDTYGIIKDLSDNQITEDDDSGANSNFSLTADLISGEVYLIGTKIYDDRTEEAEYAISVSETGADTENPTGTIATTKDVASSQTATFTIRDNVATVGYYWGKSSNYSENKFVSTFDITNTENITESGTYYLNVKDSSDNVSEATTITYYKTVLNMNDGKSANITYVTPEGLSIKPSTPTRDGYVFSGWSTDKNATSGVTKFAPAKDETYYAIWTYDDVTKPTGSISSTNNLADSQTVTLSLNDDYNIGGYYWGTSSDYTQNTYTATTASTATATVSSSGTYYLNVQDGTGNVSDTVSITFYKTSFNSNGGTGSVSAVLTASGKSFTVINKPTKTGYIFNGWAKSSTATSGSTTITPTGNSTYYATWKYDDKVVPTASISSTNNLAASQTVTLTIGDDYLLAGYYWGTSSTYSSNTYTATTSTSITKTISSAGTYYLTSKDNMGNVSNTVSITFYKTILNQNDGTGTTTTIITKEGNSFTPITPTRDSYKFKGWSTDVKATTGSTSITPDGNKTYYAIWEYIDKIKPTGAISSTNDVSSNQTVTLSLSDNVAVEGYYWGTDIVSTNNTYTSSALATVTKNISSEGTYYLTVKDTSGNLSDTVAITFYKTTLNSNGGTGSASTILTASGNSFTPKAPEKDQYIFKGWAKSSTATTGITTIKPDGNDMYYAIWKFNDVVKPTASISATNNLASYQTATLTISDEHELAGYYWGTSETYSNNTYTATSLNVVTKSITEAGTYYLNAVDGSGNLSETVSITFYKTSLNVNGGLSTDTYVLTKGGNSFTPAAPTRTSYLFKGWSTDVNANTGITTISPVSNETYYAIWEYVDSVKPTGVINSTNNLADSQTVTLSLNDDVKVKGYYWGTNGDYSENTFVETSSTSAIKNITSEGTYYLTVEDVNGNISDTQSITFCKTTLDYNDGTGNVNTYINPKGSTINLPVLSKDGYDFMGWSVNSGDTTGEKSISVKSDATYYPLWKVTPTEPTTTVEPTTTEEVTEAPTTTVEETTTSTVEPTTTQEPTEAPTTTVEPTEAPTTTVEPTEATTTTEKATEATTTAEEATTTQADKETYTYYFAPLQSDINNGCTFKALVVDESGSRVAYSMTAIGKTVDGRAVYATTVVAPKDVNMTSITLQTYKSGSWLHQITISGYIPYSAYNNKVVVALTESTAKVVDYKADEPTTQATTVAPTTVKPTETTTEATTTTVEPTTVEPTEATTVEPTTVEPTEVTTVAPTTVEPTTQAPTRVVQKITVSKTKITKTYGCKAFSLNAKAKTTLTYKSSNTKVATVSKAGKVTLKGIGTAKITITASQNDYYTSATKTVTIVSKLGKITISKPKVIKKFSDGTKFKFTWKKPKGTKYFKFKLIYPSGKTISSNKKSNKKSYTQVTVYDKNGWYNFQVTAVANGGKSTKTVQFKIVKHKIKSFKVV